MKTNDNKSVKPQHLAAVALATAVTLPGMAILAEEADQKPVDQNVVEPAPIQDSLEVITTPYCEEKDKESDVGNITEEKDLEESFSQQFKEFDSENKEIESVNSTIIDDPKSDDKTTLEGIVEPNIYLIHDEQTNILTNQNQKKVEEPINEAKPLNNSVFQFGDGSEENPYQVSTAEQLDAVRNDLSAHYIQMADIDLIGINWAPIGNEKAWRLPIGLKTSYTPFIGTFNGQNFWIKNCEIKNIEDSVVTYGLFGVLENARIENVNIELNMVLNSINTDASVSIGGIAGLGIKNNNLIKKCNTYGKIQINDDDDQDLSVGGIVGRGHAKIEKSNNYADMDVSSFAVVNVGGLEGSPGGDGLSGGIIQECINYGNINVDYYGQSRRDNCIGGLVGKLFNNISYSENHGKVTVTGSAFHDSSVCVGGLCGYGEGEKFYECINSGEIEVERTIWELTTTLDYGSYETTYSLNLYVGGLIWKIELYNSEGILFENCKNTSKKIEVSLVSIFNSPIKQSDGNVSVGGIAGISFDQRDIVDSMKKNLHAIDTDLDILNKIEERIDAAINQNVFVNYINTIGYPLPNLSLNGHGYNHSIVNADEDTIDSALDLYEEDIQYITKKFIASSPEKLNEELSKIIIFNNNPQLISISSSDWIKSSKISGEATILLSVKALKGGETSFGLKLGDEIISEVNCKVIPKFTLSESKVSLDQDKKEVTLTAESEFISDELANEILDKLKWENNSSAKVDIKKEFKDGKFAITFTLYPSMEVYKDESSSLVIKNLNMKDITLEIFQKGHFEYKELYQILNSPGFKNSMIQYLTKDGNFTASLLVSEKDPKFGTALVKAYSDLYFRGLDGWKEIIASEASKDLATDILIGYIYNSSDIISQMSAEKEGFSLVKKLSEALKWYLAKEMNEHLEDAGILNQLNKEITSLQDSSEFSKALISGKIDDVLDILVKNGSNISAKKISDFFNRFYKSSEYVNKASEYLKKFGYAVDGIMVTKDTMNNFSKFNALANANKYYIEMLDYIEKNCELKAMVNASKEVKALIYREFSSLEYVLQDAIQKGTDIAINEALKFAGTKVPILNIIKTGFDLGKFAGNALFNVSSMQESYDKLRCYTYLNKALSSWTISKNTKFAESLISQNNVDADNAAYEYLYTLDILAEGRIGGEKTLQKYLDYIWMNKNEELIRLSKTIQEGIESQNKYWDLGKLMEKCVTVNISCPVDIQVFDKNGGYLFTIKDGKEMAEQLDGLRYNVEYDQLVDDYNKILTFNPETGYSLKLVGYSTGCVDYLVMYKDENGLSRYKTINNIPIEKGTEISIKHIDENAKLILSENDLKKMVYEPVLRESQKYQKVDSIDLKVKNRVMAPGESQPIYTVLNPSDSTISDVYWSTSNSDIIRISDDGILTAIKSGTATIWAYTVDGAKKRVIITVSNLNEIGDKTDDPINDKNPSEKPTPPINDPNKKPDTNDPGDTNKPDEKPSNNTPVIKPMVNKGNETKVIPVKAESTIEKVNGSSIKHSPETGIAIQKSSSIWMNILSLLGLGWIVHKKRNH